MKGQSKHLTETFLVQIIERCTRKALTPIAEREITRKHQHENDAELEYRLRRNIVGETEVAIRHQPVMRRKLSGTDWCVDCVML